MICRRERKLCLLGREKTAQKPFITDYANVRQVPGMWPTYPGEAGTCEKSGPITTLCQIVQDRRLPIHPILGILKPNFLKIYMYRDEQFLS